MTVEKAQTIIGNIPINPNVLDNCYSIVEYQEAKTMAIEALEQKDILNEIKEEITRQRDKWSYYDNENDRYFAFDEALAIIDTFIERTEAEGV